MKKDSKNSDKTQKPLQLGLLDMLNITSKPKPKKSHSLTPTKTKQNTINTQNTTPTKTVSSQKQKNPLNTSKPDNPMQTNKPKIYTVTEFINAMNFELKHNFGGIWVEGEIVEIRSRRGIYYFALKEKNSVLNCKLLLWEYRPSFQIVEGIKVKIRGTPDIYPNRGNLSFSVDFMEEAGLGDLAAQFERLKKKLMAEGLFNEKYKKPLPKFPKTVGIVTSEKAAALRDILKVFRKRMGCRIIISPSLVQGKNAPTEIISAINTLERRGDIDIIICARGGGSAEDLSCFNDESVVRAIFNAKTPIVTGIGHQIDFTLSDFVADKRAATPTEAAEIVFPDMATIDETLKNYTSQLIKNIQNLINIRSTYFHQLAHKVQNPQVYIERKYQELSELNYRLENAIKTTLKNKEFILNTQKEHLSYFRPSTVLNENRKKLDFLSEKIKRLIEIQIKNSETELSNLKSSLRAMDPNKVLKRGYALISNEHGKVITSVDQSKTGEKLKISMNDGSFFTEIKEIFKRKNET